MRGQKPAFTLAEVLITLAVIGIVAVLTIGIFLPKIQTKVWAAQTKSAKIKFTKAMEQMALNGAIGGYYSSTEEFVDELQNYLKISKVCSKDNLAECFNYDKMTASDNAEVEINDLKLGKDLGMKGIGVDYKDTISILTLDGTSMILSWNKECPDLTPGVYEWSGDTNESTGCVAAIMDLNGDKGPNKEGRDVQLFNAKQLGRRCAIRFDEDNICWSAPIKVNKRMNLTKPDECQKYVEAGGDARSCVKINGTQYNADHASGNLYANNDAFAYAVTYICGGTQNMPSESELKKLPKHVYKTSSPNYNKLSNLPTYWTTNLELDESAMEKLGLLQYFGGEADNGYGAYFSFWAKSHPSNLSVAFALTLQSDRVDYSTYDSCALVRYVFCLAD